MVGVIHTPGGFLQAGIPGLDAVEVRVDALSVAPRAGTVGASVATIVTVRCAEEAGSSVDE